MSEQRFIVPQYQCEHGQLARACNIWLAQACNICELQTRIKELELALDNVAAQRDGLLTTAKAVIERWHTPLWKDAVPTTKYISAMREVVTKVEAERAK